MSEKKIYNVQRGVSLDAKFLTHVARCEECRRFDAEKPGTLALLCLEGTVLWKQENREPTQRKADWKPETVRSKKEVKAAMKYKGDQ